MGEWEPNTRWNSCGQAAHEKVCLPSRSSSRRSRYQQVLQVLLPRYYLVEKTKDATRIGLLVGTLGTKDFTQMLDKLRQVIVIICMFNLIMMEIYLNFLNRRLIIIRPPHICEMFPRLNRVKIGSCNFDQLFTLVVNSEL